MTTLPWLLTRSERREAKPVFPDGWRRTYRDRLRAECRDQRRTGRDPTRLDHDGSVLIHGHDGRWSNPSGGVFRAQEQERVAATESPRAQRALGHLRRVDHVRPVTSESVRGREVRVIANVSHGSELASITVLLGHCVRTW